MARTATGGCMSSDKSRLARDSATLFAAAGSKNRLIDAVGLRKMLRSPAV
jgi:hypothetical protein